MTFNRLGAAVIGLTVLGAFAVQQTPASAAAPPVGEACARQTLPMLSAGAGAGVSGTDPTGRYQVGWSEDAAGNQRVVRWRDGVLEDLGDGHGGGAGDVNGDGEVVGVGAKDEQWQGWRWRGGGFSWLPAPGPDRVAQAHAVNGEGEVAGHAEGRADTPFTWGRDGRVVVWSADDTVRELVRPSGFNEANAIDIDDDGTVVGVVQDWDYDNATTREERVVVWFSDGSWRFLPDADPVSNPNPVGIHNGVIAGTSAGRPVVWQAREGGPTEVAPGLRASVVAFSGSGSMVITAEDGDGGTDLLQNGVRRPLPFDESADSGAVTAVDNNDVVYGWIQHGEAPWETIPVRWDCRVTS